MEEYYQRIQDKLLIQKDMIDTLLKTQNTRVRSDYYEAIVRDLVRESVSKSFSVARGIILSEEGQNSEECDLILYESSAFDTWFQSGEIVVISPEAVRAVVEIKRTLASGSIKDAINNLLSVSRLRRGIFRFIVGFTTNERYDVIVKQCIESKTIHGMFVFNTRKSEDDEMVRSEMKRFMEIMKRITNTSISLSLDAGDYFIRQIGEFGETRIADNTVEEGVFITTPFE